MAKLGWGMVQNKDAFWARFLRHMYKCGNDIIPRINENGTASHLWKGIADNRKHVERGLNWRIGNGQTVRFWEDEWVAGCWNLSGIASVVIPET